MGIGRSKAWTEKEFEFACDNYGLITTEEISKKINHSPHAIRNYMSKNNISIWDNFYTTRLLAKELGY